MRKKVIVALSGGQDSAAAAYLLKKNRHRVTGMYLRLFCDEKREESVKKIADVLKIPLIVKDVCEEFKKVVINNFLRACENGETPNPCVVCNEKIKFKYLLEELKKERAEYVATGHYAQVKCGFVEKKQGLNKKEQVKNSRYICRLYEAADKKKDQSYFLYNLKQNELFRIIFPLGEYNKNQVREIVRKARLPIQAEESQNICFIKEKYPDAFLVKNLKLRSGKIIDIKGRFLGYHRGLALYTLGQRRGIGVGGKGPFYVVSKNLKKNELIVASKREERSLFGKKVFLNKVNWIVAKPKLPLRILARSRYQSPKVNAIIKETKKGKIAVFFASPQRALTSGQSVVFYTRKGEIVGGGVIT